MSRKIWITRDAQGNLVSSTDVRSSSGCPGCIWVLLDIVVVVGPAAWAANGDIPVTAAVGMYVVDGLIAVAALIQYAQRRAVRDCPPGPSLHGPRQSNAPITPNSPSRPDEGEYDARQERSWK